MKNRFDSQVCVVILAFAHYLGTECSRGTLSEEFIVVFLNVKGLFDLVYSVHCDVTSALKSISNFEGMDALIEEFLCLLEDGSSKYDNTGGSVTNFIVL